MYVSKRGQLMNKIKLQIYNHLNKINKEHF